MEQLVLLVLIGLIGLINWIIQQAAEARERRKLERKADQIEHMEPVEQAPPPARREVTSDESMRRLMEALGLPEDAPPLQPPQRREPEVVVVQQPPPLPRPRREIVVEAPRPIPIDEYEVPARPVAPLAPAFRWEEKKPSRKAGVAAPAPTSRVRAMLASPSSLRDAVILTEILGKPKALS